MNSPHPPIDVRPTPGAAPAWAQALLDASHAWAAGVHYRPVEKGRLFDDTVLCEAVGTLAAAAPHVRELRAIMHDLPEIHAQAPNGLWLDPIHRTAWVSYPHLMRTWPRDRRAASWYAHRWAELWVRLAQPWLDASAFEQLLRQTQEGLGLHSPPPESRWGPAALAPPDWERCLPSAVWSWAQQRPAPRSSDAPLKQPRSAVRDRTVSAWFKNREPPATWRTSDSEPWLRAAPWFARHTRRPWETWSDRRRWAALAHFAAEPDGAVAHTLLDIGVRATPEQWAIALARVQNPALVARMAVQGADVTAEMPDKQRGTWGSGSLLQHAALTHLPRALALVQAGASIEELARLLPFVGEGWELLATRLMGNSFQDPHDPENAAALTLAERAAAAGLRVPFAAVQEVFKKLSESRRFRPEPAHRRAAVAAAQALFERMDAAGFDWRAPAVARIAADRHLTENAPLVEWLLARGLCAGEVCPDTSEGLAHRLALTAFHEMLSSASSLELAGFFAPWQDAVVWDARDAQGREAADIPEMSTRPALHEALRSLSRRTQARRLRTRLEQTLGVGARKPGARL